MTINKTNSFINSDRPIVIKLGGNALTAKSLDDFSGAIAKLVKVHQKIIIVHGGGPQIDDLLNRLFVESRFINGLRYTCPKTLAAAEMALCGQVNKSITQALYRHGVDSIGLSGKDSGLMSATQYTHDELNQEVDFGYIGLMPKIRAKVLTDLLAINYLPVIAPIAYNSEYKSDDIANNTLNINADYVACAVANAVKAHTLFLMSNIDGVLDKNKQLLSVIKQSEINQLINDGVITGGMIPKLQSAVAALENVDVIKMINGEDINAINQAFTGIDIGTAIIKD